MSEMICSLFEERGKTVLVLLPVWGGSAGLYADASPSPRLPQIDTLRSIEINTYLVTP
jgi:hypothetical protein